MTSDTGDRETNRRVLALEAPLPPERLAAALQPEGEVAVGRAVQLQRTYLDSFDWRVWGSGGRLVLEESGGRQSLHWHPGAMSPVTAPVAGTVRFASDLPAGPIRRDLAPILEMRALLPMGRVALRQRLVRVLDGQRKTVALVWWEERSGCTAIRLRTEVLTGYERAGEAVHRRLLALEGVTPAGESELALAAAEHGRRPGDYSSRIDLELKPETPAGEAARAVLRRLADTLRANVDGAVEDLDTEFLHDLRVAVRRTRAALGQLKAVLDPEAAAPYVEELRWLGNATGPCRDLDVFQLDVEGYRKELAPDTAAALQPLADRLHHMRAQSHRELAADLRSRRFSGFIKRWDAFLDSDRLCADTATATLPVRSVAADHIQRAYGRFLNRAQGMGPQPPAEGMHRLRIDAKKLRYLLEFFASALGKSAARPLVRELKAIQDTLGAYHDLHVQQLRLQEVGRELLTDNGTGADTLLAMGRLSAFLETRQEQHHHDFARRFATFSDKSVRKAVARLGGAGERAR